MLPDDIAIIVNAKGRRRSAWGCERSDRAARRQEEGVPVDSAADIINPVDA